MTAMHSRIVMSFSTSLLDRIRVIRIVSAADATISELAAAQRASIADAGCAASQESHRIASAVRLNGWRPAGPLPLAGQIIHLPDLFTKSAQPSMDVGIPRIDKSIGLALLARAKMQHRENGLLNPVETNALEISRRNRLRVAVAL